MKKLILKFNIILRRYTVLTKLVLIGLLLGIPLTILLFISLSSLLDSVEFANMEKAGVKIFRPLTSLQVHLTEHKAYTFSGVASGHDYQSEIAVLNSRVKDEFDKLIAATQEKGSLISVDEETLSKEEEYYVSPRALLARWEKLVAKGRNVSDTELRIEYDKLADDIQKLMKLVTIRSRLILDPEGDSYHLMYVAVHKMPKVHDLIGGAFVLAIDDVLDSVFNSDRLSEMIYLSRSIKNNITDEIPSAINTAIELDPEFNGKQESIARILSPLLDRYKSEMVSLVEIFENIIRNNRTYGIEDLTAMTIVNLDQSLEFSNATFTELDKVLDTAITRIYYRIIFRLMIAGGAFILAMIFIYFTARGIINPVNGVAEIANSLAEGDIKTSKEKINALETKYLIARDKPAKERDEIWALFRAIRTTIFDLEELLGEVGKAGIAVTSSVTQISSSVHALNAAINQQAASTAEVNATGKEIYSSSIDLSRTVGEVADKSGKSLQLADRGVAGLNEITGSMASLEEGSRDISEKLSLLYQKTANISNVITTITKIATQTNLLSLNASIEAEKAGEYGSGFSVVAAEIKRLAEETAMAALEIEEMIHEMQQAVKAGVIGVEVYTGTTRSSAGRISGIAESINEIIQYTRDVLPSFEAVSSQMQMQTDGAAQISDAMNELNTVALHTRESISEFSEITQRLEGAVVSLREVVSKFRFGG